MITRSKLVEQLRDYQIRSQHKCSALTIFSPKPFLTTWFDVAWAIFFALLFGALVMLSYLTLYLRYYWTSFAIICIGIFVPWRLRISRQALARKKKDYYPCLCDAQHQLPYVWPSGLTNRYTTHPSCFELQLDLEKLKASSWFKFFYQLR